MNEKHRILNEFNNIGSDYSRDKTIREYFEGHVAQRPNHIVVIGPGHREMAVNLAGENGNKEKYLFAYFVSDRDLPVTELREYLSKAMPDYMVPSYFGKNYSLQSTNFYEVQGDHYSIFKSPPVKDFAKTFEQIMKINKKEGGKQHVI